MTPEEQFEADHAAGNAAFVTASRVSGLIVPVDERPGYVPSAYALAQHMLGSVPLPDIGDDPAVRRGKEMEPIALQRLVEDYGYEVRYTGKNQLRLVCPDAPLVARPDAMVRATPDDPWGPCEAKTVWTKAWEDQCPGGSLPLAHRVQLQSQLACGSEPGGTLAVLIISPYSLDLEVYDEPRHEPLIAKIKHRVKVFVNDLSKGVLPPRDNTMSSYRSWTTFATIDPDHRQVRLVGPQYVDMAVRWAETRATASNAAAASERYRCRFAAAWPDDGAARVELDDGTLVIRTPQRGRAPRWTIKRRNGQ